MKRQNAPRERKTFPSGGEKKVEKKQDKRKTDRRKKCMVAGESAQKRHKGHMADGRVAGEEV